MQNTFQIKKQSEVLILGKENLPETTLVIGEELALSSHQVDGPYECECGNCNKQFYFAEICPSMIVQVDYEDMKFSRMQ